MNYKTFKTLVQEAFESMLPGFTCIPSGEFPYFIRRQDDLVQYVHFAVSEGAESYKLYGIVPSIRFCAVETLFAPLYLKYSLQQQGNETATINGLFYNIGPYALQAKNTVYVKEVADFMKTLSVYKDYMEYITFPFFQRFDILKKVHTTAMEIGGEKFPRFFSGAGPFKLMAIKRLLHSPDYETYARQMIEIWTANAQKYPQYFLNYDNLVVELYEILNAIEK